MDYSAKRKVYNSPELPVYVANQSFHPSDSLHVILASGSGGLSQALRARSARSPPDYESLEVHLEVQGGTAVLPTAEDLERLAKERELRSRLRTLQSTSR